VIENIKGNNMTPIDTFINHVKNGNLEGVRTWLEKFPEDTDRVDSEGRTAIRVAIDELEDPLDIVMLLLLFGADPNPLLPEDTTLVKIARENGKNVYAILELCSAVANAAGIRALRGVNRRKKAVERKSPFTGFLERHGSNSDKARQGPVGDIFGE